MCSNLSRALQGSSHISAAHSTVCVLGLGGRMSGSGGRLHIQVLLCCLSHGEHSVQHSITALHYVMKQYYWPLCVRILCDWMRQEVVKLCVCVCVHPAVGSWTCAQLTALAVVVDKPIGSRPSCKSTNQGSTTASQI